MKQLLLSLFVVLCFSAHSQSKEIKAVRAGQDTSFQLVLNNELPCDTSIKRIIIQRLDSSFCVIETKEGIIYNWYTTDSMPLYQYTWLIYTNGLPYKQKNIDRGNFNCTGISLQDRLKPFMYKSEE